MYKEIEMTANQVHIQGGLDFQNLENKSTVTQQFKKRQIGRRKKKNIVYDGQGNPPPLFPPIYIS